MKLKFWAKEDKKDTKGVDTELLDMDFFCQLSYMAAIATSGIARSGLIHRASQLPYMSARYFKKIDFVAKTFNRDYSEACRIVGEATKEPQAKALLLRLSGALSSGEDTASFLERESQIFSESYSNRYERRLETLRKWTDAYVAMVMTAAVVVVVAVVSIMIGSVTMGFIITISAFTILLTVAGAWLLHKFAPKEIKTHSLPYRSREQELVRKLAKFAIPTAGGVALIMLVMKTGLGWPMIAAGALLMPLGVISLLDDRKIDKRDNDIASFLRSLGGMSQAIGATITEAMGRLDFRSLGSLKDEVNLLYTRLLAGINPHLCWERFVGESGSEQVNRSVRIFQDGVTLGGEPERVGNDASSFAMKIALLRAKRGLVASGFSWLAIVMHLVITALVVFIYEILDTFSSFVTPMIPEEGAGEMMPPIFTAGLFSGGSTDLNLLHFMVTLIIIVLTFVNAFAIYSTTGGHIFKLTFYLAITMAASGAAIVFVPNIVNTMFTTIA
jgi:flagellar protein FlaJ